LDALLKNPHSNYETHLHLIADISVNFLLNEQKVSNIDQERSFKEMNALFLGKLCKYFEFKYPQLQIVIYQMIITKLKSICGKKDLNANLINGIFLFLSLIKTSFYDAFLIEYYISLCKK